MFKGFMFFFKQGLKYDKRYILWLILLQLVYGCDAYSGGIAAQAGDRRACRRKADRVSERMRRCVCRLDAAE